MFDAIDLLSVSTIRMLSLDQVESAGSGHSGAPLGQAPMAHVLWTKHLNVNPQNPDWPDRDRFVLSAGHGSPLLYSLLNLSGYDVSLEDLKGFRHFNTKTPGHPEVTHTPGVEATTGPLGQGVATAVGMAMAEEHLAATYNKKDIKLVDHFTYVIAGDGDLQEGVAQEASSLAGHLQLEKLIMLYDSNEVQLDGPTSKAFSENVEQKYKAYGWHYIRVDDGNDLGAINNAIELAKGIKGKPTIIEIRTEIGFGTPSAGTSDAHSDPIGHEGMTYAKKAYEWLEKGSFVIPDKVYDRYLSEVLEKGKQKEKTWQENFNQYKEKYPESSKQFSMAIKNELPNNYSEDLPVYNSGDEESSRDTSNKIINTLADTIPQLWGGSADLASSNKTLIKNSNDFMPDTYEGRNIWYGVREFAMGAILNGITLHGGTISYAATFFVFSDYLRPAIRLAALSKLPNIYVFTHDSIILGFDGATHEPVEHLASYRAMPNITLFRPSDANETIAAWKYALESVDKPTILALSRQGLPVLKNSSDFKDEDVYKGAYIVSECEGELDGLLIATGSEVSLAVSAQKELEKEGIKVRVVSMPSMELFKAQDKQYQNKILPEKITKRLVIEAGSSLGWGEFYGKEGNIIAIDEFGISGPGEKVYEYFGFTVDNVVAQFKKL